MPPWSYGNRLFRSIWVETDEEGLRHRKIGRYRHASGRIYLPFGQSWPIFRRHVYLTTGAMTSNDRWKDLQHEDQEELDLQLRMENQQRCPFLFPEYWSHRKPTNGDPNLFWCSIDLKTFYPSMQLDVIQQNIVQHLPAEFRAEALVLLSSMLKFPLDLSHWSIDDLKQVGIRPNSKYFRHVPTGLYVAGFLAWISTPLN